MPRETAARDDAISLGGRVLLDGAGNACNSCPPWGPGGGARGGKSDSLASHAAGVAGRPYGEERCRGRSGVGRRVKISAVMPNLATNHIVRVAPIVKALQRDHDVKLIGILKEDEELFPPFAKEFDYTVVRLTGRGGFLGALRRVQEELTGDLVYA